MNISKIVGANVRRKRNEKNLSQKQLAKLCNFSRECMKRIESGPEKLRVEFIERVANALEVPILDLIDDNSKDINNLNSEEIIDIDAFEFNMKILIKSLVNHTKETIDKDFKDILLHSIAKDFIPNH